MNHFCHCSHLPRDHYGDTGHCRRSPAALANRAPPHRRLFVNQSPLERERRRVQLDDLDSESFYDGFRRFPFEYDQTRGARIEETSSDVFKSTNV